MADRIEREIEEILEKLDTEFPPDGPERTPISILSRRKKKPSQRSSKPRVPSSRPSLQISPTALLFIGAALVVSGLILSNIWGPMIWLAFAGVVLFIGAFLSSFFRSGGQGVGAQPRGAYWRSRYIPYEPERSESAVSRFRRKFRRH